MATILRTDDTQEEVTEWDLDKLQKIVGGYIEGVTVLDGTRRMMYVNEEGLIKGLPLNRQASLASGQDIVGDALLLTEEETAKERGE